MKKIMRKTVTAVLAVSMLFSMASCASKKSGKSGARGGTLISEKSPWFNTRTIEVTTGVDESREIDYVYSQMAGTDDKNMVVYTQGNYRIPNDFNWETGNYYDYLIANLSVIDRATTETVKTINIKEFLNANEYADTVIYRNGKITVSASSYDEKTYAMTYREIDIDPATGNVTDTRVKEESNQVTGVFDIGDYQLETTADWSGETAAYNVYITSPDGSKDKVEIKDEKTNIYSVDSVIPIDDKNILIPASADIGYAFYELNLETKQIAKADSEEYEWLNSINLYNLFNGSDGCVYSTSPAGISKIDMKNKKVEEVFNYSWCGVDRNTLTDLGLVDFNNDTFILCGEVYTNTPFTQTYDWSASQFKIIEFTKADKNPHAGKRILELFSSYGYTDDVMSEAIKKYNDSSDKYFIEVTDRYSSEITYSYENVHSNDDESRLTNDFYNEMSNKLSMDIMNGDGPDMFLDVSYLNKLNNGNYLADLTPYVGALDSNKYFTNVIDSTKVDGKLYNLPICFGITGIHTDSKYAGASGVGFTTDEYVKFLSEGLNGEDVITKGQAYYFTTLFNAMRDKFIFNGKADFSGPEFAALAEYVKDNVQEKSPDWDEGEYGSNVVIYGDPSMENEIETALYTTSYGFSDYFQVLDRLNGANAVLGIPSADGRGPMVCAYSSIAVSAQAYDVDACGEFVKLLISDDIQNEYAKHGNFVLNRQAFRETGEKAVKYFNETSINNLYGGYYGVDVPDNRVKYTTEHVDNLENIISNCSIMLSEDSEINKVLIEEMPSYFSGQKSIEEVINIAQDRVQKVLNERG